MLASSCDSPACVRMHAWLRACAWRVRSACSQRVMCAMQSVRVCVHTLHPCVRACVRACVCACMPVHACMCASTCVHACVRACACMHIIMLPWPCSAYAVTRIPESGFGSNRHFGSDTWVDTRQDLWPSILAQHRGRPSCA